MGNVLVPAPSYAPKPKNPPTPKKDNPVKDAIYHQCGEVGHWRRNCPVYIAELMKKKKLSQGASTSGIFTIELYSFPSTSWVCDTGCSTHICITTQGLMGSKKLKPRALSLYVGDGYRAAVEAIGEFHLCLPSGLVLILHNCHYAPSITRGIISVLRLYKDSFVNRFENDNSIFVSKNNLISFNDIPRDDIYEIVMSSSNTNESSMFACVACMSGKMARKPYSHQVERAKDLLGLIYTDVCGPFKIISRQGASYFVTFTNDFSSYGYVYLLKHKHEVFETFKVFQKEVENQLGKTIKSLRSDYGGEYMSQEFLNHLRDHGIIAHRTPPYTPQHNDTSLNHEEDDQEIDEPQSDINPIRRSTRTHRATDRLCLYVDAEEHELGDLGEPANYKAALLDPESLSFLLAQKPLVINGSSKRRPTWMELYTARLVAKGFTQTLGIDYEETFSPIADIRDIRIFIAIAAFYDYETWQMDVKIAFLNGYLNEEEGFDRWDLDFDAWKFCFLPGKIASCLVIFFISSSLFVAIYLDIDSKIMMIVVCL
ncbi:retrotransposon protein, putative, ty1-copia subclass [Tanacetum coccineum]